MKTLLKISILLNLGLAGGLIWTRLDRQKRSYDPVPQTVVETQPVRAAAATPPRTSFTGEPKPFRWSQLESKDYPVYVKNLRAIGCPEPVLRAIVSADVQAAYAVEINALEKRLADLRGGPWTNQLAAVGTETALKSELQQIPDKEAAEINELLGIKPAPAPVSATVASTQVSAKAASARIKPISMPLALQNIDLTALNLNDNQKQVIADVRQNFLAQIGGANQNPDDPAYLERWEQAQPEADAMLRGMLGTSFFQDYQLAAAGNGQNQTATNP